MSVKNNQPNRTVSNQNRTIFAPKSKKVTRGYQKISSAAHSLGIDFRNLVVLDIGSSTGGFTQYALERGAAKVIAIEKGTNQMMASLRFNPNVDLHEKTDIFSVVLTDPAPDLILADVSFISLKDVLAYAKANLSSKHTKFLVMLKPQFEASPDQLNKGIVKNSKIRREIIKDFEIWLKTHGFVILNKIDNQLAGKNGNLERFYYLSR